MAANSLCVCPMAIWLWVCRPVTIDTGTCIGTRCCCLLLVQPQGRCRYIFWSFASRRVIFTIAQPLMIVSSLSLVNSTHCICWCSCRAVVVVGNEKGTVGVGTATAKEVIDAVQKAVSDAKKHFITVPLTRSSSFPHRFDGIFGAAKVMLRPAAEGTGVIAGAFLSLPFFISCSKHWRIIRCQWLKVSPISTTSTASSARPRSCFGRRPRVLVSMVHSQGSLRQFFWGSHIS